MISLVSTALSIRCHKSYFNPFEVYELLIEVALAFGSKIVLNDSQNKMQFPPCSLLWTRPQTVCLNEYYASSASLFVGVHPYSPVPICMYATFIPGKGFSMTCEMSY